MEVRLYLFLEGANGTFWRWDCLVAVLWRWSSMYIIFSKQLFVLFYGVPDGFGPFFRRLPNAAIPRPTQPLKSNQAVADAVGAGCDLYVAL